MKSVFQEDANGCWIACASMLTEVDYEDIKSQFKFRAEVTVRSAGPLVNLLDKLGFDCEKKSTKIEKLGKLRTLDVDALVYFKNLTKKDNEKGGYWIVWDSSEKVLRDPEGWNAGARLKIKNFRRVIAKPK